MFPRSFLFAELKSFFKGKSSSAQRDTVTAEPRSVEELKSRIAVRFFVKKSKRFGLLSFPKQKMREDSTRVKLRSEPSPECLQYLGLAPRNGKPCDRKNERKRESQKDDFEFTKPRAYECEHCPRVFFHKLPYRRHMIRHIKKINWCLRCNRGFATKIAKKRHQLACRR